MGNKSTKIYCANVDLEKTIKPSAPPLETNDDPTNTDDPVCIINTKTRVIAIQPKKDVKKEVKKENLKTILLLQNLRDEYAFERFDNTNLLKGNDKAIVDRRHVSEIVQKINKSNTYILKYANNIEFLHGVLDGFSIHFFCEPQEEIVLNGMENRTLNDEEKKLLAKIFTNLGSEQFKNKILNYI